MLYKLYLEPNLSSVDILLKLLGHPGDLPKAADPLYYAGWSGERCATLSQAATEGA